MLGHGFGIQGAKMHGTSIMILFLAAILNAVTLGAFAAEQPDQEVDPLAETDQASVRKLDAVIERLTEMLDISKSRERLKVGRAPSGHPREWNKYKRESECCPRHRMSHERAKAP